MFELLSSAIIAWQNAASALSEREIWPLVIICALFVHYVYNRFEPQPINLLPTLLLLVFIPLLPAALLVSQSAAQSSVVVKLQRALLPCLGFYATLITSIIVYRISPFHPLADVPGPSLARLSQALWASTTLGKHRHKYYKKLHERYGPYVRVGPNEVSCSDPNAIPVVLGTNGWRKGPMWNAKHIPDRVQSLVGLQNCAEHHERRKSWTRAFSTAAVKGYEGVVEKRVAQLVDELEQRAGSKTNGDNGVGETVDLANWFSRFAFDFMGDMAFGGGFNLMKEGDTDGIWHIMEGALMQSAFIQYTPYLVPIIWKFPSTTKPLRKFVEFSENQVTKRLEKGSTTKDLFHYLTNEDKAGAEPTPFEHLLSDASLAVVAGSDTTSTVLGMVFFSILADSDIFTRLRGEVDRYFPPEELGNPILDSAKLADMPYLNAVINEAMRLQPPVPINIQRATFDEWKWTGSRYFPPGTAINMPPYIFHRDPQNFSPLPDTFWPDRWLPIEQRRPPSPRSLPAGVDKIDINNVTTNTSVFIPFSFGPANCAGKSLAILEMRTVVSYILRRFDLAFDDGYDASTWEKDGEDFYVFQTGSLPVRLACRS